MVMDRIDAHNHYWYYDAQEYSWIGEEQALLKRDFLPEDLLPELEKQGVVGTVAVQARERLEENRFLLELANKSEVVQGVVGWIDYNDDHFEEKLKAFAMNPKAVGLRHFIQSAPDETYMFREEFMRGIAALKRYGLTYDILIGHKQLPATLKFVELFPDQPFVLDHIAKPPIKAGLLEPWKTHIQQLALHPHVHCKLSGLVTEADWNHWREEDIEPYLEVVLEAFGSDRLMFGSDWPVCLLAAPYNRVLSLLERYIKQIPLEDQEKIMGRNARSFYKLK